MPNKTAAVMIFSGALLLAIATILHPVVVDPHDSARVVHHIQADKPEWMMDHAMMTAALILWLTGLSIASRILHSDGTIPGLFMSSLAIWLVVMAFELGGLPLLISRLQQFKQSPTIRVMIDAQFASTLVAGYLAMIPAWMGVVLFAWAGGEHKSGHSKWSRYGVFSGLAGVAGIIATLLYPTVWLLLITTALPYVWTLAVGWGIWNEGRSVT